MTAMRWTNTAPTEPGFYWWRNRTVWIGQGKTRTTVGIGKAFVDEPGPNWPNPYTKCLLFRTGVTLPLTEYKGYEFAGPIPEPEA